MGMILRRNEHFDEDGNDRIQKQQEQLQQSVDGNNMQSPPSHQDATTSRRRRQRNAAVAPEQKAQDDVTTKKTGSRHHNHRRQRHSRRQELRPITSVTDLRLRHLRRPSSARVVTSTTVPRRRRQSRVGTYSGEVDSRTKIPHGQGVMTYDDGSTYKGSWFDADWSGIGTLYLPPLPSSSSSSSISSSIGSTTSRTTRRKVMEMINLSGASSKRISTDTSRCDGSETFGATGTVGATYEGAFLDNLKHGVFVVRYDDGRTYDGSFKLDRMQRGHMTIPGIGRYYGDFDEYERPHGRGKFCFDDGRQYDGEFSHGQIEGHGRMNYGNLTSKSIAHRSSTISTASNRDDDYEDVDVDVSGDGTAYTTDTDFSNSGHDSIRTIDSNSSSSSQYSSSRSEYSFYLGSFTDGKRSGEGVLMVDEQIIHDGHWHDDEPVVAASLPGVPVWMPNKKQKHCLGRIPQGITPHSRFSHRKPRTNKTDKNKKKDGTTKAKKTKIGRRARHMVSLSQ